MTQNIDRDSNCLIKWTLFINNRKHNKKNGKANANIFPLACILTFQPIEPTIQSFIQTITTYNDERNIIAQ